MTLDEVIKLCEEIAEEQEKLYKRYPNAIGYSHCPEYAKKHRQLAEWLKDYKRLLEQESKTRWIPVSERLPEDDEDILITYKGNMGHPITSVSYYDGDFRTEDGEGYFSEVIAWMPLPTPYKAESEE